MHKDMCLALFQKDREFGFLLGSQAVSALRANVKRIRECVEGAGMKRVG